ncbi:MAG: hypothetical protein M3P41_12525, partial [Actinomycetota bacterium]|nr:hypothetical protein [Actinomycetota bacterium]
MSPPPRESSAIVRKPPRPSSSVDGMRTRPVCHLGNAAALALSFAAAMEDRYDPKQIEPRWQRVWADERTWEAGEVDDGRPTSYVLEMLPYPSGEPHIG